MTINLSQPSTALTLFTGLLDDAAVYPPEEATMVQALYGYAAHRASPYAFMQGPFVVPVARIRELLTVQREIEGSLRLAVVMEYADLDNSVADVLAALSATNVPCVSVATVEVRLPSAEVLASDLRRACEVISALCPHSEQPTVFFESSRMATSAGEPELLANAVASVRRIVPHPVGAKLRSGGLTSDAVPSCELVARFIVAMRDRAVAWKATAGLHHPVRGVYGGQTMHGFLNVLAATLAARTARLTDEQLVNVLNDTVSENFRLTETRFAWRDVDFDHASIAAARRDALRSFGSCSFDEPVDGLRELQMLSRLG